MMEPGREDGRPVSKDVCEETGFGGDGPSKPTLFQLYIKHHSGKEDCGVAGTAVTSRRNQSVNRALIFLYS